MIRAHQIDRRELDVFTNQMLEDDCENTFDEPAKESRGGAKFHCFICSTSARN